MRIVGGLCTLAEEDQLQSGIARYHSAWLPQIGFYTGREFESLQITFEDRIMFAVMFLLSTLHGILQ